MTLFTYHQIGRVVTPNQIADAFREWAPAIKKDHDVVTIRSHAFHNGEPYPLTPVSLRQRLHALANHFCVGQSYKADPRIDHFFLSATLGRGKDYRLEIQTTRKSDSEQPGNLMTVTFDVPCDGPQYRVMFKKLLERLEVPSAPILRALEQPRTAKLSSYER